MFIIADLSGQKTVLLFIRPLKKLSLLETTYDLELSNLNIRLTSTVARISLPSKINIERLIINPISE